MLYGQIEEQKDLVGNIEAEIIATGGVGGITEEELEEKLADYVQFTDIASKDNAGVVYLQSGVFGIGHNKSAGLYITQATEQDIDRKTNQYQPITPKGIDRAVKVGVTTNTIELTDEEKVAVASWLGTQSQNKPNTLVQRYSSGNIAVPPMPTADVHATSKEYVDNKFNGANKAVSFMNYSAMISSLNSLPSTSYNVGQNVMVVTLEVPDLWVSEIAETSVAYTYVSDDDFVSELNTNGSVQVGYYKLSALETQKVDLTNYVKNTDYATTDKAGIIKGNKYYAFLLSNQGMPAADTWSLAEYQRNSVAGFIGKGTLENIKDDYIKRGLTENSIEFTNEEKTNARNLIGAVGNTDIATVNTAGVVKVGYGTAGLYVISTGELQLYPTETTKIDQRNTWPNANKFALTLNHIDYAVKKGLTENSIELTNEEKVAIATWLSGTQDSMLNSALVVRSISGDVRVPTVATSVYGATSKRYVDNLPDYLSLNDEQKAKWQSWLGIDQLITGALEAEY